MRMPLKCLNFNRVITGLSLVQFLNETFSERKTQKMNVKNTIEKLQAIHKNRKLRFNKDENAKNFVVPYNRSSLKQWLVGPDYFRQWFRFFKKKKISNQK